MAANKKPFRFFDLPRELRDRIYCECTSDVTGPTRWPSVKFYSYTDPNLRLLCQQFKEEYEEEVLKGTKGFVAAHPSRAYELLSVVAASTPARAGLLHKIRHVELRMSFALERGKRDTVR